MKKNNTAEKAALDAEKITKALQESTEKSLRDLINEAISNVIAEDDDELEEPKDDSYDVEDVEPDETPEVSDVDSSDEEGGEEGAKEEPAADEEGGEGLEGEADDEWSDMEQYKIGDDDYDFTGVDGDEILKVYNKLGDDDQIFVKKEDDGTYSVKDDETGAEFVIELNPEAMDAESKEGDEEGDVFDVDLDGADDEEGGDEFDFGGEEPAEEPAEEPDLEGDEEIEIDLGDDDEDDKLNEEGGLNYTTDYQKDVFKKKFNMNEPADGKTTYSMDAGAPKGAEKPWAGKGDPKPFGEKKDAVDENVDECGAGCDPNAQVPAGEETNLEENGGTIASTDARHMKKGQIAQHRPNAPAYDVRKVDSPLNESMKKVIAKAKAIQAENKQYKDNLDRIKKSLYEAAVLNVNLGMLVDILVNESTTRDEKKNILNRFNNVKTISEGKALRNTIKAELNEKKTSTPLMEKQFAASTESLNETTIYSNANDPSLDLMRRMEELYKK